jgi:type VI secretion system protein ImpL
MINLSGQVWQWVGGLIAAILTLVGAYFVLPKLSKTLRSWGRWGVLVLSVVACLVLTAVMSRRYPSTGFPDSALPPFFRESYWGWMLGFGLGAVVSTFALAQSLLRRRGAAREAAAGVEPWPELDAAWDEILVRLGQAKISPADQRYYLLIAPDEDRAAALVRSAGLQVYVEAPEAPAPVHAYATSDAVLLSCSGASDLGTPGGRSAARMEALCRKLLALQPDCPVVRGVVVLFPIDWSSQPESVSMAAAVREDLRAVRRVLKVRCPVFAVFPEMETVPGFPEFTARLASQVAPQMLDQRVGFAVPSTEPFSGDLVQRGLVWLSGWFHSWVLNLLAGGPLNDRSNGQLVTLDYEIRRYRKRLRAIMESAFSTHRESDPVLFRGCYFMATGEGRHDRAFSAGLFRGARSRVVADHVATVWGEEAEREDRRYGRLALAVGVVGGALALVTWLYIASRTPWGWLGLLALVVAWMVVLLRVCRQ